MAQLLVPPTNSIDLAEKQLRHLPTGGQTPLTAGLHLAHSILAQHQQGRQALQPLLVCLTDGRANSGPPPTQIANHLAQMDLKSLLIDSEQGYVRFGQARQLAQQLDATYIQLDRLGSTEIARTVRHHL